MVRLRHLLSQINTKPFDHILEMNAEIPQKRHSDIRGVSCLFLVFVSWPPA